MEELEIRDLFFAYCLSTFFFPSLLTFSLKPFINC
jgi:hypothetical protein